MKRIQVLGFVVFFSIVGCTGKKATTALATDATPTEAAKPSAAPAKVCANGSAPQILSGSCQGEWKVAKAPTGTTCEFTWGPPIKCPDGTKSLGFDAVCYGVTGKAVAAGDSVSSSEDCAKKFGATPMSPAYELQCCAL